MKVATAAYFVDRPMLMGDPTDDAVADRNYRLCRSVDLLKLPGILDEMVAAGMKREQATCFLLQADALLQLMRTENNRLRLATQDAEGKS